MVCSIPASKLIDASAYFSMIWTQIYYTCRQLANRAGYFLRLRIRIHITDEKMVVHIKRFWLFNFPSCA